MLNVHNSVNEVNFVSLHVKGVLLGVDLDEQFELGGLEQLLDGRRTETLLHAERALLDAVLLLPALDEAVVLVLVQLAQFVEVIEHN